MFDELSCRCALIFSTPEHDDLTRGRASTLTEAQRRFSSLWLSFLFRFFAHTHTLTHSTQCLQNILHILHLPLHFLDIFFLASCLFSSHLTSRLAHGPIFRVTFALTFHRDDDGTFASAKFIFFFLFCFIFQSRSDDVIR